MALHPYCTSTGVLWLGRLRSRGSDSAGLGLAAAWDGAGFPAGSQGSGAAGMFCTHQALEKQTRRWASRPFQPCTPAHSGLFVCFLARACGFVSATPRDSAWGRTGQAHERERVCVHRWVRRGGSRPLGEGVCVCVCTCACLTRLGRGRSEPSTLLPHTFLSASKPLTSLSLSFCSPPFL